MAKTTLPAKAGLVTSTAAERADGRTEYHVRPGVPWVNGKRVRDAATVFLSLSEAVYDLSLDRIAPATDPVPDRWTVAASADDGGAADGGD